MIETNHPSYSRLFFSASLAHCFEVLTVGHVLDRIKVYQETHPKHGVRQSLRVLWERGHGNQFSQGLRWNVVLGAIKGGFGWSIFNFCNRFLSRIYQIENQRLPKFSYTAQVAFMTAFVETSLFICPLERLKIFEMTLKTNQSSYVASLLRERRVRWIFQGWRPTLLRQSTSWVTYLVSYQFFRQKFLEYNSLASLSINQKILLGLATGNVVGCVTAPLDLLKTQAQNADANSTSKITLITKNIWQNYGWKGMYNGLGMKLIRTNISTIIIILTLDYFEALPKNMKV